MTFLESQVRTLSTGQVHRLGLARAMIHRPSVLLLDEPTRSLDPMAAAEFRRFLKSQLVDRHGTTVLFASHTLAEVEQLADRVILLDKGRLVACDSPRGLRDVHRLRHARRSARTADSARLSGRGALVNVPSTRLASAQDPGIFQARCCHRPQLSDGVRA